MSRSLRVEFEGAWYHVMARGNRREAIFGDAEDRAMMVEALGQASERSGWEVHAWVLMGNHFHFVIHTPNGNLVEGMKWFMYTYTRRLNSRHRLWGRVFGDRYKSLPIEPPAHAGEADYLRTILWYVHLNPVRAGLVGRDRAGRWQWESHRWSSLVQGYLVAPGKRPSWMQAGMRLSLEYLSDSDSGRRAYRREADRQAQEWRRTREDRKADQPGKPREGETRGWMIGGETFRDSLIERVERAAERVRNRNYRASG